MAKIVFTFRKTKNKKRKGIHSKNSSKSQNGYKKPKTIISLMSGFLDVSTAPKTNIMHLWRPITPRRILNDVQIFVNLKIWDSKNGNVGNDGRRTMMKNSLNILNSLNMGAISPRTHEMDIWQIFETCGTKKL